MEQKMPSICHKCIVVGVIEKEKNTPLFLSIYFFSCEATWRSNYAYVGSA